MELKRKFTYTMKEDATIFGGMKWLNARIDRKSKPRKDDVEPHYELKVWVKTEEGEVYAIYASRISESKLIDSIEC